MPEPDPAGGSRLKRLIESRPLRAAVSLLIMGLLIWRLDFRQVLETLGNVDLRLLAIAVLVLLIANMVSIYKWKLILMAQEIAVSFFYLTSIFYIGLFFNNFLLSSIGGDVVKAFKLSKTTGRAAEATGSVVVDRASSAFALLVMAVVGLFLQMRLLDAWIPALILAMCILAMLFVWMVASERSARWLSGMPLLRSDMMGLRKHARSLWYSLHSFRHHHGMLTVVMLISLVFQSLTVLIFYILARSLGIDIAVIYYFLFIPIALAVSMLPISLNGLGVREAALVAMLGIVGVARDDALSLALLALLVMTLISLIGGAFLLFDSASPATSRYKSEN